MDFLSQGIDVNVDTDVTTYTDPATWPPMVWTILAIIVIIGLGKLVLSQMTPLLKGIIAGLVAAVIVIYMMANY